MTKWMKTNGKGMEGADRGGGLNMIKMYSMKSTHTINKQTDK